MAELSRVSPGLRSKHVGDIRNPKKDTLFEDSQIVKPTTDNGFRATLFHKVFFLSFQEDLLLSC